MSRVKRKQKVSEPAGAIAVILSVVRLRPPGIELMDFREAIREAILTDPKRGFSALRQTYGFDTEVSPFSYSPDDAETLRRFTIDRNIVLLLYQAEVLAECLIGLPPEFTEHIGLPEAGLESMYLDYQSAADGTESFVHYVANSPARFESFESMGISDAIHRYHRARRFYHQMYAFIAYLEWVKQGGDEDVGYPLAQDFFVFERIKVIENRVTWLPDFFTKAFEGVEIDRLRLCDNCGRVYWVKRLDMKGCTVSCAKILRTRKWREKITAEQKLNYKINRIKKETKNGE